MHHRQAMPHFLKGLKMRQGLWHFCQVWHISAGHIHGQKCSTLELFLEKHWICKDFSSIHIQTFKKSTMHMKEDLDHNINIYYFIFLLLLNQTHTNLWEEIHVYTQQFPHLLHPTCWPALKSLLLHSIGCHHTSLFLRSTKVNHLNMTIVNSSTLDCRTVHANTQTLTVKILSLPDLSYIWRIKQYAIWMYCAPWIRI